MQVITVKKSTVSVVLSKDEIHFLNNAINETFNALDKREFQTRTGFYLEEARQLQQDVGRIADAMRVVK
jgi:hypothetical protein